MQGSGVLRPGPRVKKRSWPNRIDPTLYFQTSKISHGPTQVRTTGAFEPTQPSLWDELIRKRSVRTTMVWSRTLDFGTWYA